jgi:hypothetical protein
VANVNSIIVRCKKCKEQFIYKKSVYQCKPGFIPSGRTLIVEDLNFIYDKGSKQKITVCKKCFDQHLKEQKEPTMPRLMDPSTLTQTIITKSSVCGKCHSPFSYTVTNYNKTEPYEQFLILQETKGITYISGKNGEAVAICDSCYALIEAAEQAEKKAKDEARIARELVLRKEREEARRLAEEERKRAEEERQAAYAAGNYDYDFNCVSDQQLAFIKSTMKPPK